MIMKKKPSILKKNPLVENGVIVEVITPDLLNKVREMFRRGLDIDDILQELNVKKDTWNRHFTRRYGKNANDRERIIEQDLEEIGLKAEKFDRICDNWKLEYDDKQACAHARVKLTQLYELMNLNPEFYEEERSLCLADNEYRRRLIEKRTLDLAYQELDPDRMSAGNKLNTALNIIKAINPMMYDKNDARVTIHDHSRHQTNNVRLAGATYQDMKDMHLKLLEYKNAKS